MLTTDLKTIPKLSKTGILVQDLLLDSAPQRITVKLVFLYHKWYELREKMSIENFRAILIYYKMMLIM